MKPKNSNNPPLVVCDGCGQRKRSMLEGRNVCNVCYNKEPLHNCENCGLLRRLVAGEPGLCLRCSRVPEHTSRERRKIICEICGRSCRTMQKNRDICSVCYTHESSGMCRTCNRICHLIDSNTGLCPGCTERAKQGRVQREFRQIICVMCGKSCSTQYKSRDICATCLKHESSYRCKRCNRMRHDIAKETGLCSKCIEIITRSVAICSHCSRERVIFDSAAGICQPCHRIEGQTRRMKIKGKVQCSKCNKECVSSLARRAICTACYSLECKGIGECSDCHKVKKIAHKRQQLCNLCFNKKQAASVLRRYAKKYVTSFPYNQVLFNLLIRSYRD